MGPVFLSEVCLCLRTDLSPCVWVFQVGNAATLSSGGGRADGFYSVPASDELRTATSIHMHSWEQNWAKLNFVSPKMESFACRRWQVFVMYCMRCVCVGTLMKPRAKLCSHSSSEPACLFTSRKARSFLLCVTRENLSSNSPKHKINCCGEPKHACIDAHRQKDRCRLARFILSQSLTDEQKEVRLFKVLIINCTLSIEAKVSEGKYLIFFNLGDFHNCS